MIVSSLKISESNRLYDVKYAPFADSYMGMAHGNGYEHLKRWLKNRLIFCDTLFDYAPSYNNDMLTIRANTTELMNIEIETYTPVYQHVSWYNGQMDKKKINGKTAVSFSGTAMAETDQEVLIYGGSNIKKISGITSMNPNQMLIGSATRLSELSAPNCPLLADINSNKANLSPHTYLNKVDLSNCPQLGGILRLNNSQLVRDVNISGTTIDGLQLPTNVRNLEVMKLSEDVANVTLRDAVLLKELSIPTNIEYLSLINVPNLTTITSNASSFEKLNTLIMENPKVNPISNIVEKASNLQYVRLIGLDIACSVSQMQLLSNLKGIDSFGNEIPISQSISGKVTLTQCSEELEIQLKEIFPLVEFIITSYAKSYTVTFVDGDGNVLYVTQTLQNDGAIYIGNTPTKTSTKQYNYEWVGWDKPLKPITSDCTLTATFNEILRYYTIRFIYADTLEVVSEQILAYGETITKPTITNNNYNAWTPIDNIVTGDIDFYTTYIPYPEDLSIFTFNQMTYNGETGYECILNANTDVTLPSYLIIPFEYEGLPVLAYGQTYAISHSEVNEVYFPEVIKFLSAMAFYGFSSITDLYLPNIIKFVSSGTSTTYGSTNLQFGNCSSLKSVKLPKLQELPSSNSEKGAFRSCSNLEYVWLGSEDYPFKTWRTGSTGSTYAHFYGSTDKLQFINLITENGVESDVAAYYEIYDSVKEKIMYSKKPIEVYSDDNFEYMIIGEEAKIIAYNGTATEVTIPNTVNNTTITSIGDDVFYNSSIKTTLTSVIVPTTVTSLSTNCFYDCSALTSVTGLDNVTSLGDYCFQSCSSLTSIDIPNVTSLGDYCFQSCSSLTSIDIPNVTSLGNNCFFSCSSLTSIDIPNVTSLGNSCFSSCSNLTSIDIPNVTSLGNNCFSNCSNLTLANFPLVTAIPKQCFYYCKKLISVNIVSAITLGDNCFNHCEILAEINLPNVTTLGYRNFYYCYALTSLHFPKLITTNQQAFGFCSNLTTITIGDVGNPIIDTSKFNASSFNTFQTSLVIYVTDPSNPPTLTGSPWGATNATITYEQA